MSKTHHELGQATDDSDVQFDPFGEANGSEKVSPAPAESEPPVSDTLANNPVGDTEAQAGLGGQNGPENDVAEISNQQPEPVDNLAGIEDEAGDQPLSWLESVRPYLGKTSVKVGVWAVAALAAAGGILGLKAIQSDEGGENSQTSSDNLASRSLESKQSSPTIQVASPRPAERSLVFEPIRPPFDKEGWVKAYAHNIQGFYKTGDIRYLDYIYPGGNTSAMGMSHIAKHKELEPLGLKPITIRVKETVDPAHPVNWDLHNPGPDVLLEITESIVDVSPDGKLIYDTLVYDHKFTIIETDIDTAPAALIDFEETTRIIQR